MSALKENNIHQIQQDDGLVQKEPTVGRWYTGCTAGTDYRAPKHGDSALYKGNGEWTGVPGGEFDAYAYDFLWERAPEYGDADVAEDVIRTYLGGKTRACTPPKRSTEEQGWAYGRASSPLLVLAGIPWIDVLTKARDYGGRELGNRLAFEDAKMMQLFTNWYADTAPAGVRVRVKVKPIAGNVAPVVSPPQFKALKELRMWHWRAFLYHRKQQRDKERLELEHAAKQQKELAHLHLSAVQVLNDSLPGTAEQDCAEQDATMHKG